MSTSTSASISVKCSYLWDKMLTGPQQDTASSSASFPMLRHHRITPCFERQPNVSERDLVLRPPSPIAVRAATLISVTFPSLMRAKRMRARASTDGVLRFPTGVYSTTPSVQNRVYMHVFAPPSAKLLVVIGTRRCVNTTAVLHASSREYGPPRVLSP